MVRSPAQTGAFEESGVVRQVNPTRVRRLDIRVVFLELPSSQLKVYLRSVFLLALNSRFETFQPFPLRPKYCECATVYSIIKISLS
jgi:hypothetical protein